MQHDSPTPAPAPVTGHPDAQPHPDPYEPVTALPTRRAGGCPFAPPPELGELRAERPIAPLRFPDGHTGRLVTGHSAVRAILADARFSARYELMHHPLPDGPEGPLPPAPVGDMTGMDAPEHTRYRRLLMGKFTVRRMRALTERVRHFTAETLDAMERRGPGVDLVEVFAQPIPALMICELLGVPHADRDTFHGYTVTVMSLEVSVEERYAAMTGLQDYLRGLVLAKRAEPTDDLLSDLTREPGLTDEEIVGLGALLLAAGLDTTANMLAHGTFALLSHPEQFAALRDDPSLAEQAIEELLRFLTVAPFTARVALEDVEIDGELIGAGETVICSLETANRDPSKFPEPDTLDLRRRATGHLGFGHGIHQCLGQQLARVEMAVALPALVARFPTLRLAVPAEEIPLRTDMNIYGVHRLPVAWDEV
ncbi:cytochrome P450 [Streptomyces sp. URMC 123]|uniref:cytochrome P450 n=1 Tax=Streptomyces sp. URMC 123 TaxID=3423403 RepID=UPI003F1E09DA